MRVHNGHVRQGWILLINSTGYIVPSLVDIPCVHFLRIPSRPFLKMLFFAGAPFLDLPFSSSTVRESGILLSG